MPVRLNSSGGGSVTMDVPAVSTTTTLNLPTVNGTLIASDNSGNVTYTGTTTFSGNAIFNAGLVPSSSFLRNRIINGDMRIDQRYGGGSVSISSASNTYFVDRWRANANGGGVFSVQRSTTAPAGFTNSILATVTTADSSVVSGDFYHIRQEIEGFNFSDFGFGASGAQTVTISFWVRASLTGIYTFTLRNNAGNRGYTTTYNINTANTFEYKTITIAGDTTGTWPTDNSGCAIVNFGLGNGNTQTLNSWQSTTNEGATGQTQWISTNGATFFVTGVQLEVGSVATPFERRQYGQEIALCQRYYNVSGFTEYHVVPAPNATYLGVYRIHMPVQMRANPTVGVSYSATNAVLDFGWYTQNFNFMVHYITASVSTNAFMFFVWTASAEL
jgi:hypothetical protein